MSARSPKGRKCPICGKSEAEDFKPFCSNRCANVDLSRWLKGGYAIPSEEDSEPSTEDLDEQE